MYVVSVEVEVLLRRVLNVMVPEKLKAGVKIVPRILNF